MAESTLTYALSNYRNMLSYQQGWGRDYSALTAAQQADINSWVHGGYMQFLYPPPIPGEAMSHRWSFLRPIDTIAIVAADTDYDMEDDFGGIDGPLTFATADNQYHPVDVTNEVRVREMLSRNDRTGPPECVAIQPKTSDQTDGQRFQMIVFPIPDGSYTLSFRKMVMPNALTDAAPYSLGGAFHSETVLASCLSQRERAQEDLRGRHWEYFIERLIASVQHDRQAYQAEHFGYNADCSDTKHGNFDQRRRNIVTYNGTQYQS